ncbi:MAG: protoglobin domain-containing protein [Phycisphaerae bacterium]
MDVAFFEDMKRYVGFGEADVAALASLAAPLEPVLPEVADVFYERLLAHPGARYALRRSRISVLELRKTLYHWMREIFVGTFDAAYFRKRCEIGRAHVRASIPQRYVHAGMSVIRDALVDRIESLHPPKLRVRITALHKLLDLELAIMTETYREYWVTRIQESDRARFQRRLSESEHLANVGELAAALAHEIKNPLAGISGAIQVLGADLPEGHPHKEAIDEALRQIDRLDATVKDLLIYARPKPPTRTRQKLGEIVERALILFRAEPVFRRVRIGCEGLDGDTQILADEHQIQQVITNLMLNAAHACEDGGEVVCRIEPLDDGVRVEVVDNGVGMASEVLDRAFEPFYTTKARGTGLGLPICKRIIDSHGGRIRIDSTVGKGTRIVIELPRST